MALETGTYISDLVTTNPVPSDPVYQAQAHLTLIKSVLKNTFPNIKGPVTATNENLSNGIPVGLISMWSGSSVPAGWTLCNGVTVGRSDGTGNITPPDLRDRFIVGSGGAYSVGTTGGASTTYLTVDQLPPHSHSASSDSQGNHSHTVNDPGHQHYAPVNNSATGFGSADGPSVATLAGSSINTNATPPTSKATTGIGIAAGGIHNHNITVGTTGAGAGVDNRPPYFALAFIMKV